MENSLCGARADMASLAVDKCNFFHWVHRVVSEVVVKLLFE